MMVEALTALGLAHRADPQRRPRCDDPQYAATASRAVRRGVSSPARTYLQDASDAGARVIVGCAARAGPRRGRPRRRCRRDGARADGPDEADGGGADRRGGRLRLSSRPHCSCDRGIGGPAVGKHLRLHPTYFVTGIYDEQIDPWIGQFQAEVSVDFAEAVEGVTVSRRVGRRACPRWTPRGCRARRRHHKGELTRMFAHYAPWLRSRSDTGAGEVMLDLPASRSIRW